MVNIQYIDFPNDYVIHTNNNVLGGIVLLEIYINKKLSGKIYQDNNDNKKLYLINYEMTFFLTNMSIIEKLEEINSIKYPTLEPITLHEWFKLLVFKKEEFIRNNGH
jgi:hypothetical protein